MAVLVTGGAGYVGSHTVVALREAGYEVVIVDDFSNSSTSVIGAISEICGSGVVLITGDTANPDLLEEAFDRHSIDSVLHFAARKSVAESVADPAGYYEANIVSTLMVARAAIAHGVRRLVFSSSAAVYGSGACLPAREDAPLEPESPYGASKAMCERILSDIAAAQARLAAADQAAPLAVVMLRYFNPAGAHPSGLIGENPAAEPANLVPRVMAAAESGGCLEVYGNDYGTVDGTAVRDYVHVCDIASGHLAALQVDLAGVPSRAYNLGTGTGSSVLEVLYAAKQAFGVPIPHRFAPRRPGDAAACWADCTRAKVELPWQARYGLAEMLTDGWRARQRLAQ